MEQTSFGDICIAFATVITPLFLAFQMVQNWLFRRSDEDPRISFSVHKNAHQDCYLLKISCYGGKSATTFSKIKVKDCLICPARSSDGHCCQPSEWSRVAKGEFFVNSLDFPELAWTPKDFVVMPTVFEFWLRPQRNLSIIEISLSIRSSLRSISIRKPQSPALMMMRDKNIDA